MRTENVLQHSIKRPFRLVLVGVFIFAAAALALPLYTAQSSSHSTGASRETTRVKVGEIGPIAATNSTIAGWWSSVLRLPVAGSSAEAIATFASDCTTPRTAFILGETVCAQTSNVTESDRFVNWCVACPTIDYGGAGVTDINQLAQPQNFLYTPTAVGTWKATIADPSDSSIIPAVFTVTAGSAQTDLLATYEAPACVVPKTVFNLGETVCARAISLTGFRFAWVDPAGFIEQRNDITTDPQTDTFTLPATATSIVNDTTVDNRGTWRVNAITSRGSLKTSAFITVRDPGNARVDLAIVKTLTSDSPVAGGPVQFAITVKNQGPDDAVNAHLVDNTFTNASFNSLTQTSGPTFSCSGADCTIASLPNGAVATFTLNFTAGTAGGVLQNTATVSSATTELNPEDNSSTTAGVQVGSGGTPPTCSLQCPNNLTVSANTTQGGNPGAVVTLPSVEAFGTCGAVTLAPASGTFFQVGSTVVNATASGGGVCSFTVTVIQTAAPTITCPSNITVTTLPGASTAYVPNPAGVTSNPGNATTTGSNVVVSAERSDQESLSDTYPIGVTTITWTATDDGGRTASCNQIITVISPDAPTISCPSDRTFAANAGDCQKTLTAGDIGTATIGGTNTTLSSSRSDGLALTDPYPAGQTVITWTATNAIGSVSCSEVITITTTGDTIPPVLTIPPDLNVTTTGIECSELLDDELGVATATDNCTGSVPITRTGVPRVACPIPGDPGRTCESFIFPVGTTDVTYTATDASGNTATGVQHVTVHEPTPPTFTFVPGNLVNVPTGPGATFCGTFVGDATLGTAIISDACDPTVIRSGVPAGNIFPVGSTTITYTAKADLSVHATQIVTVVDNTPPVVTVPNDSSTDAGSCTVTIPNVVAGSVASDNCGIRAVPPGVEQVPAAGTVVGLGPHDITVTATDVHGNTTVKHVMFTVNGLQFTGNFWLGLKNSDDVGTKFDLLVEVLKNGTVVGSNQINDLSGGSSGFNNAILRTVNGTITSTGFCTGDTLGVRLSVRVASNTPPGHISGTARLWYGDSQANSRFSEVVNGVTTTYYLRNISNALVLDASTGSTKFTIDVLVNKNQNGNPFKPFGTWTKTF